MNRSSLRSPAPTDSTGATLVALQGRLATRLSAKRMGHLTAADDDRSAFEIDYDRIAFAGAFRALADKTQVHGRSGNGRVRSRLTHSLEVSRVGRTLGTLVGKRLIQRHGETSLRAAEIGQAVAAACLMHDIGNPPFGHSGEKIISRFFRDDVFGRDLITGCRPRFRVEATHFEGNAQGFRVVTRLQGWRSEGGLMLTSATLSAFGKYPRAADPAVGVAKTKHKYGFYESDAAAFAQIAADTGMIADGRELAWRRHPLAYLVEAADDICYLTVDLEDAVSLKIITFAEAEELLAPLAAPEANDYGALAAPSQKLEYLRGRAIQRLIDAVVARAGEVVERLEDGTHPGDLLDETSFGPHIEAIARFSDRYIYKNADRLAYDGQGEQVLTAILKAGAEALLAREKAGGPIRHPALALIGDVRTFPYEREGWIRALLDWIASLTDGEAIAAGKQIESL